MIEINGSFGEGGGQIIRTSLSLSAITRRAVKISNIRQKRPKPGLQAQHLTACQAVNKVSQGHLLGANLGSDCIDFEPGDILGQNILFDVGTAGSTILVAQTLIPLLVHAKESSCIRIKGGTHVMRSPGYDYFNQVYLPAIRCFGVDVNAKIIKHGFYPKGGGLIEIEVKPSILSGCDRWVSHQKISAIVRLANLPLHIAEREKHVLQQNHIEKVDIEYQEALSPGNVVTLWEGFKGVNVLGERGKRAEVVAQEAVDSLRNERGEVDRYLADQLLIYAALAKGKTVYFPHVITEHVRTNIYVIERFIQRKFLLTKGCIQIG